MNKLSGYDALHHSAAWLDLSARGKIKLMGEDRVRLLHAMTTNHIEQLRPGTGCYAYFLSAQGRILADVNVLCRPDHFLLDTEPETREKVLKHLDSYIIADDVTLDDATHSLATIAVEGPQAGAALSRIGAPTPECAYDNVDWGTSLVVNASYTGGPGYFIITRIEQRESLLRQLEGAGVSPASEEAYRVVRIENGRPRYGEDISERFLAQEANQSRALHFQKGCYLGQEIVERVRSRGQVHRLLVPLQIDACNPPQPGTKLHLPEAASGAQPLSNATKSRAGESIAPEVNAGEITSAAFSPALGKIAALGYVRTEYAKPGANLSLAGETVVVS